MEAYSLDLRQRIVNACDDGEETHEEIAQRFAVSISFITKLLRRRKNRIDCRQAQSRWTQAGDCRQGSGSG